MYDLGKVLLFFYSRSEFNDMSSNDPSKSLHLIDKDSQEGRDIIEKLLQPSPGMTMHDVIIHLSLWFAGERLNFFRDVSDHLEDAKYHGFLEDAIEGIREVVFPKKAKTSSGKKCWPKCFGKKLIHELVQNKRKRPSKPAKVQGLVRFIRNIISHHVTLSEAQRGNIGLNKRLLEQNLRMKFPNLLLNLYKVVEKVTQKNNGKMPLLQSYYEAKTILDGIGG